MLYSGVELGTNSDILDFVSEISERRITLKKITRREFIGKSSITITALGATIYLNPFEAFSGDPDKDLFLGQGTLPLLWNWLQCHGWNKRWKDHGC